MRQIDLQFPERCADWRVVDVIDRTLKSMVLRTVLRGTLRGFPGSVHWHAGREGERGTLEITWWPARRRAWFSVQSGRDAEWISPMIERFRSAVERQLAAPEPAEPAEDENQLPAIRAKKPRRR